MKEVLLLLVASVAATPQANGIVDPVSHDLNATYVTNGLVNGNLWTLLKTDDAFKTGMILGVMNAFTYADDKGSTQSWFPWPLTNGEAKSRVDSFYQDPKNLNIPVLWALGIIATQIADHDFKGLLLTERQMADEAHSTKQQTPRYVSPEEWKNKKK